MDYKKQLIEKIESFYVDVVEEYTRSRVRIMADSKFRSIFKRKNYGGNVAKLRECKKAALAIDIRDLNIPKGDRESDEVEHRFERCLVIFNNLCDAYIDLQLSLKKKAEGANMSFAQYREVFQKVQDARAGLNSALHELDIVYTDYTCDEEGDPYTYID